MKTFKATVKTSNGEVTTTVRAHDIGTAKRLFEQQGKLLYIPKIIPNS